MGIVREPVPDFPDPIWWDVVVPRPAPPSEPRESDTPGPAPMPSFPEPMPRTPEVREPAIDWERRNTIIRPLPNEIVKPLPKETSPSPSNDIPTINIPTIPPPPPLPPIQIPDDPLSGSGGGGGGNDPLYSVIGSLITSRPDIPTGSQPVAVVPPAPTNPLPFVVVAVAAVAGLVAYGYFTRNR